MLITISELKASSVMEDNIAEKDISIILAGVQNTDLRKILGKDRYHAIIAEADAYFDAENPVPFTPETWDMITDYIRPYLIAATMAKFVKLNSIKLTNKGLQTLNANNANAVEYKAKMDYQAYWDSEAASAKLELIEAIKTSNTDTSCGGSTKASTTFNVTGIYVEKYNDFSDYFQRTGRNRYL